MLFFFFFFFFLQRDLPPRGEAVFYSLERVKMLESTTYQLGIAIHKAEVGGEYYTHSTSMVVIEEGIQSSYFDVVFDTDAKDPFYPSHRSPLLNYTAVADSLAAWMPRSDLVRVRVNLKVGYDLLGESLKFITFLGAHMAVVVDVSSSPNASDGSAELVLSLSSVAYCSDGSNPNICSGMNRIVVMDEIGIVGTGTVISLMMSSTPLVTQLRIIQHYSVASSHLGSIPSTADAYRIRDVWSAADTFWAHMESMRPSLIILSLGPGYHVSDEQLKQLLHYVKHGGTAIIWYDRPIPRCQILDSFGLRLVASGTPQALPFLLFRPKHLSL
jgi:hypothetical protein